MRFLHLSDLHFGKSIYGTSLIGAGDQPAWVDRFLELVRTETPEAVVIAGDVYDRSAPSAEAVELLSRLLTELARQRIPVLLVAGNHDSAQRLAFARELLGQQGVLISPALTAPGRLAHVTLEDEAGPVTFWLMPYCFPALVGEALGIEAPRSYDEAIRLLLAAQEIDFSQRNVLIAHQNVTANGVEALRGGSETMVGGVGQVDYTAFDGFDYVALGHIHAACPVGRDAVRYAGSPLCYHFDELRQPKKGALLVELGPKGAPPRVETILLPPLHPLREERGEYEAIRDRLLADAREGEYLRVALTDRRVSPEIASFFRELCRARGGVLMEICSEYAPYAGTGGAPSAQAVREKGVEELFADFYAERRGGATPDEDEWALLRYAGEALRRADAHTPPTEDAVAGLIGLLMGRGNEA